MIGEVAGLISGCEVMGMTCEADCDVAFMGCASWEEIVSGGRVISSVSVIEMRSCVGGEVSGMGCSEGSTGVEMGFSCLGSEDSSSRKLLVGWSSGDEKSIWSVGGSEWWKVGS